jgi:hypothetical protein
MDENLDTDVRIGIEYHYKISAFNASGNESGKSDAVSYTLLEKPALIEPIDQAIVETITSTFAMNFLILTGYSVITNAS